MRAQVPGAAVGGRYSSATIKKVPTRKGPCRTPPYPVTPRVLLLTRVCLILPYPAQFPTKKRKKGSFTQKPCNTQLPSTIQIQSIHTEGFLSIRRLSHGALGDTGGGHVQELHQRGSPEISHMNTNKAKLGRDGNVHNHSHRPLNPWTQNLPLTCQHDAPNPVK